MPIPFESVYHHAYPPQRDFFGTAHTRTAGPLHGDGPKPVYYSIWSPQVNATDNSAIQPMMTTNHTELQCQTATVHIEPDGVIHKFHVPGEWITREIITPAGEPSNHSHHALLHYYPGISRPIIDFLNTQETDVVAPALLVVSDLYPIITVIDGTLVHISMADVEFTHHPFGKATNNKTDLLEPYLTFEDHWYVWRVMKTNYIDEVSRERLQIETTVKYKLPSTNSEELDRTVKEFIEDAKHANSKDFAQRFVQPSITLRYITPTKMIKI